jgi:hypothetical protein
MGEYEIEWVELVDDGKGNLVYGERSPIMGYVACAMSEGDAKSKYNALHPDSGEALCAYRING